MASHSEIQYQLTANWLIENAGEVENLLKQQQAEEARTRPPADNNDNNDNNDNDINSGQSSSTPATPLSAPPSKSGKTEKRGPGSPRKRPVPADNDDYDDNDINGGQSPSTPATPLSTLPSKRGKTEKRGPGRPRKRPVPADNDKKDNNDINGGQSSSTSATPLSAPPSKRGKTEKRGPGRPRKCPVPADNYNNDNNGINGGQSSSTQATPLSAPPSKRGKTKKRGPGRPRKRPVPADNYNNDNNGINGGQSSSTPVTPLFALLSKSGETEKRGRGRPWKYYLPTVTVTAPSEAEADCSNAEQPSSSPATPTSAPDRIISTANLPPGWKRVSVRRQNGIFSGRYDIDLYSDTPVKMRSFRDVENYLKEINQEDLLENPEYDFQFTQPFATGMGKGGRQNVSPTHTFPASSNSASPSSSISTFESEEHLPPGWKRVSVKRTSGKYFGKFDISLYSDTPRVKMRSLRDVKKYLKAINQEDLLENPEYNFNLSQALASGREKLSSASSTSSSSRSTFESKKNLPPGWKLVCVKRSKGKYLGRYDMELHSDTRVKMRSYPDVKKYLKETNREDLLEIPEYKYNFQFTQAVAKQAKQHLQAVDE
ncbi:hypothetical protein ACOMHN_039827 [Nucella lapillus]